MNRYPGIIFNLMKDLSRYHSPDEPKTDNDFLFLLGITKLQTALLDEGIKFISTYAQKGNAANISLIEELVEMRDLAKEGIKELEKAMVPAEKH